MKTYLTDICNQKNCGVFVGRPQASALAAPYSTYRNKLKNLIFHLSQKPH